MTAAAQIVSGDVLDDTYELDFRNVRLLARRSNQRAEFRVENDPKRIGVIRFGGPDSGALWISDECIAEYERHEKEFIVTPISNGRKQLDAVVKAHPVEFLLTRLTECE
jgi:hypothetical protein